MEEDPVGTGRALRQADSFTVGHRAGPGRGLLPRLFASVPGQPGSPVCNGQIDRWTIVGQMDGGMDTWMVKV